DAKNVHSPHLAVDEQRAVCRRCGHFLCEIDAHHWPPPRRSVCCCIWANVPSSAGTCIAAAASAVITARHDATMTTLMLRIQFMDPPTCLVDAAYVAELWLTHEKMLTRGAGGATTISSMGRGSRRHGLQIPALDPATQIGSTRSKVDATIESLHEHRHDSPD